MSQRRPIRPIPGPIDATVHLPGSKSLTNRALAVAALAEGTSVLDGALFADDTEALVGALAELGLDVRTDRDAARMTVTGVGRAFPRPFADLDCRMSGTTARFLAALTALGSGRYRLDGHLAMRARPMGPIVEALRHLGAEVVEEEDPGHLPFTLHGGDRLAGGRVPLPGDVSSQFVSGLLIAAPLLPGGLTIELTTDPVSAPYLAMTLAVMEAFGVRATWDDRVFTVPPGRYTARPYPVEPDASAASYFFAAAAIVGGRVRVPGLDATSLQGDLAFVDVLEQMGAEVRRLAGATEVVGTGTLRGVEVDLRHCSDTAQTLAAVAAFADGPTRVHGIGFVRAKETDRILAVVSELRRCGIEAHELADGFVVVPGPVRPAAVHTYQDHRMAMSFALLGLRTEGIEIDDPGCVIKTFPTYFDVLDSLRAGGN